MKRLSKFLNISWLIILLVGLGLVLNLILPNLRGSNQSELQAKQARTATAETSSEPALAPTFTSEPSPTVTLSPFLEAYPPIDATLPPQPTAVPPTLVVLPPLPTYPPIGPFTDMRVVYVNHDSRGFYSIKIDGSDEVRFDPFSRLIAEQASGLYSLQVSPNGSKLLYSFWDNQAYDLANAMSIWLSDPDGNGIKLLETKHEAWFPEDGIWSPDGKQIAYRRAYLSGIYRDGANTEARELWVMDADGTNHRKVLEGPEISNIEIGGRAFIFFWSRNGYIYFATRDEKLYAVNPQDGSLYLLLNEVDPLALFRSLSPDGQHIISSQNLSFQTITQRGLEPLAVSGEVEGWSVDGSRLVYIKNGIWIRDVSTGQDRLIVSDQDAVNPSLSPDNQYLSYQTGDGLFVTEVVSGKTWLVASDPKTALGNRTVEFQFWIPVP